MEMTTGLPWTLTDYLQNDDLKIGKTGKITHPHQHMGVKLLAIATRPQKVEAKKLFKIAYNTYVLGQGPTGLGLWSFARKADETLSGTYCPI